jgi:hypothetical protein
LRKGQIGPGNEVKALLGRLLGEQFDFLLTVFLFVLNRALIDVFLSIFEHAVNQSSVLAAMAVIAFGFPSLVRNRRN